MSVATLSNSKTTPGDQKEFARSFFSAVMDELNVSRRLRECFVVEENS